MPFSVITNGHGIVEIISTDDLVRQRARQRKKIRFMDQALKS